MKEWSKNEVLRYLSKVMPALDKMDHFELLDVSAEAKPNEVNSSFHVMASSLHPDRHRQHLSDDELERLTIVYARIAEAYRVLRDPKEKELYLRKAVLNREPNQKEEQITEKDSLSLLSPKAQRLFKRYKGAVRTGDKTSALLFLKGALSLHPQSQFLKEELASVK